MIQTSEAQWSDGVDYKSKLFTIQTALRAKEMKMTIHNNMIKNQKIINKVEWFKLREAWKPEKFVIQIPYSQIVCALEQFPPLNSVSWDKKLKFSGTI